MTDVQEEGVRLAIQAAGSLRRLALAVGVSPQAVMGWTRIPAHRIVQIEMLTGIEREKLRPDLYRVELNFSARCW